MVKKFQRMLIMASSQRKLTKAHKNLKRKTKRIERSLKAIQKKDRYEFSSVFPNEETMKKAYAVMQQGDVKNA